MMRKSATSDNYCAESSSKSGNTDSNYHSGFGIFRRFGRHYDGDDLGLGDRYLNGLEVGDITTGNAGDGGELLRIDPEAWLTTQATRPRGMLSEGLHGAETRRWAHDAYLFFYGSTPHLVHSSMTSPRWVSTEPWCSLWYLDVHVIVLCVYSETDLCIVFAHKIAHVGDKTQKCHISQLVFLSHRR